MELLERYEKAKILQMHAIVQCGRCACTSNLLTSKVLQHANWFRYLRLGPSYYRGKPLFREYVAIYFTGLHISHHNYHLRHYLP